MAQRLREGDTVIVISGTYKNSTGPILYANKTHAKVAGINQKVHFVKASKESQGGLERREAPIALCKLSLASPLTGKPVKLRARFNADGRKELYFNENGQDHFYRYANKSYADSQSPDTSTQNTSSS